MSWLITNIVSALLLPPMNLVLLIAAGWALRRRWPRTGILLCLLSLSALIIFSTLAGARLLSTPLENLTVPLKSPAAAQAQAIVILGGGRMRNAPEYGGTDIPSHITLGRLRYGAQLQRASGLPLLVTGGAPDGARESEAALMARTLRQDFGVPVRWLEQDSANTAQNAAFSASLLREAGVQRIFLVTDAVHMPRAHAIFRQQGLDVIPAPTIFFSSEPLTAAHFIPGGPGFRLSYYAMHEWMGLLWYRLRHGAALSLPAN